MALQVDREEALRNQRNTITGCYNSKNPPNKPRYKYNSLPTRNLDARESSVHVSEDREPLHSFTDIECGPNDDSTAQALQYCNKTVRRPYVFFLQLIGWHPFQCSRYTLEPPCYLKAANAVWVIVVYTLIFSSCVTQILTCFRRDTFAWVEATYNKSSNTSSLNCTEHFITNFIIPDLLLFLAFVYGMVVFRWVESEQFSTLIDITYIATSRQGYRSKRMLTRTLQLVMVLGILWVFLSLGANVLRIYFVLKNDEEIFIKWKSVKLPIDSEKDQWFLLMLVITLLGFVVHDMAYVVIVTNYCIQCQLIIYLLRSIISKLDDTRKYTVDGIIQEMCRVYGFIEKLNKHFALAVSFTLFVFITSAATALYELKNTETTKDGICGMLSFVQWFSILIAALIQASRVTSKWKKLQRSCLLVRSRPLNFANIPQSELDSLVTFSSGFNVPAKLVSIPIYPSMVGGSLALIGTVVFLLCQNSSYGWSSWI